MSDVLVAIATSIEEAVEDTASRSRLEGVIRRAPANRALTDEEVDQTVQFVIRYVRSVPTLLGEALTRSEGTFAQDKMQRMVQAATAYWVTDEDVIPDELGLYGLLDDAYCSVALILALSERYAAQTGQPLVGADLSGPHAAIGKLLGPEVTDQLHDFVDDALGDASIAELLESLQDMPPAEPTEEAIPDDQLILRLFDIL